MPLKAGGAGPVHYGILCSILGISDGCSWVIIGVMKIVVCWQTTVNWVTKSLCQWWNIEWCEVLRNPKIQDSWNALLRLWSVQRNLFHCLIRTAWTGLLDCHCGHVPVNNRTILPLSELSVCVFIPLLVSWLHWHVSNIATSASMVVVIWFLSFINFSFYVMWQTTLAVNYLHFVSCYTCTSSSL